jgi:hypothetical protein
LRKSSIEAYVKEVAKKLKRKSRRWVVECGWIKAPSQQLHMTIGRTMTCTEVDCGFVDTAAINDNKFVDGLSAGAALAGWMAPKLYLQP